MSKDGKTSTLEWVILGLLVIAGAMYFAYPVLATTSEIAEFFTNFPDPRTIGPYGNVVAAIAMLLGFGGFARRRMRQ